MSCDLVSILLPDQTKPTPLIVEGSPSQFVAASVLDDPDRALRLSRVESASFPIPVYCVRSIRLDAIARNCFIWSAMIGLEDVQITRYVRLLRGGSQPFLAQASDGFHYVVKFTNNPQGGNLSFNESAGNELFTACGLPVAAWKPLLLTDDFIDSNPDCWMRTPEGVLRPNAGLCFGSRYLGIVGQRLLEILPGTSFSRVRDRKSFWLARLIDVCSEHADNRQAIFVPDADGWLDPFFVDHGHLFGGPNGAIRPRLQASCYLDLRIYTDISSGEVDDILRLAREVDIDGLWRRINALPQDWKTESALGGFSRSLDRLSNQNMLGNVMDAVLASHKRRTPLLRAQAPVEFGREPAILHSRIPPKSDWGYGVDRGWGDYCIAG
jgi:hypothetical protein